jgi:hypothetical protein
MLVFLLLIFPVIHAVLARCTSMGKASLVVTSLKEHSKKFIVLAEIIALLGINLLLDFFKFGAEIAKVVITC